MVYRHISSDMKECALRLWESGWSRQDVCSVLGVSRASIYRWAELLETFGSVTPPPPPIRGRPRIIGIAAMTAIKDIYARNCDVYLDELCWHLAIFHDIAISKSALQATLVRAGLTRKILHKIASERDEMRRAEFLHSIRTNFSGTGDEFVFIDESSKNEHTLSRLYGRAPMGQDATVEAPFIRGQRYSLVAAMSKSGYLTAQVIPGSLDAFAFFDFIVEDVVRTIPFLIHKPNKVSFDD
jgi:transposase